MPPSKTAKPAANRTDWAALRAMSEENIERIAASDEDNPATDESHWTNATVGLPARKTRIQASLDVDVVDWFKSQGRDYQTRMNAVLRRYMEARSKKAG